MFKGKWKNKLMFCFHMNQKDKSVWESKDIHRFGLHDFRKSGMGLVCTIFQNRGTGLVCKIFKKGETGLVCTSVKKIDL